MPDSVSVLIMVLWTISALSALSVFGPQTRALLRHLRRTDGYQLFRVKDFLIMGVVFVGTGWRSVVWFDLTYFDQSVFGTIDYRWPIELFIATGLMVATVFFAGLYHWTKHRQPGGRNSD